MPDAMETIFQSALAFGRHGGVSISFWFSYLFIYFFAPSFGAFVINLLNVLLDPVLIGMQCFVSFNADKKP